jgi:hypothetical protein
MLGMKRRSLWAAGLVVLMFAMAGGCRSPYYADRGALFGGAAGAGLGAVVGSAVGDPAAGALIGAGAGALTGAAVGSSLDEIEARNRAQIAAQMGREVRAGAVTMADVVAMSQAGVGDQLIITHIQHNGMAAPLSSNNIVSLKNAGVSEPVIQAMMAPPVRQAAAVAPAPAPVIIEERVYAPPPPVWVYRDPCFYRPWHHHHHGPRWGFSFSTR